jgi:hypothetical protein
LPAHGEPLSINSTGNDLAAAFRDERDFWGYSASRALHTDEGGVDTFHFGMALVKCLEAMVTKTDATPDEARATKLKAGTSLPELTALCATAMQSEKQ